MRVIHIQARYSGAHSEIAETSLKEAALSIEAVIGVALLELCGEIQIDRVWIDDDGETAQRAVHAAERATDPP